MPEIYQIIAIIPMRENFSVRERTILGQILTAMVAKTLLGNLVGRLWRRSSVIPFLSAKQRAKTATDAPPSTNSCSIHPANDQRTFKESERASETEGKKKGRERSFINRGGNKRAI